MSEKNMPDAEVIAHLRGWVKLTHSFFSWPTDGCGYDQHIKFVEYQNKFWFDFKGTYEEFVLQYADMLEAKR